MSDSHSDLAGHAAHSPVSTRIHQSLLSCAEALEADDFKRSDDVIADLTGLLDALAEDATSVEGDAEAALLEIRRFLSSPESNQMAVDVVALALPMAVAKLVGAAEGLREVGESIMECTVSVCSARDLLPILCEALDSLDKENAAAIGVTFLLGGLTKAVSCIRRHPVQQLKIVLPAVIKALHAVILDYDKEQKEAIAKLFSEASEMAVSLQQVSENTHVRETKQVLHAILGLYVLQIMALLTKSNLAHDMSDCIPTLAKLSSFFAACRLSYVGLITGSDVDALTGSILKEDGDNFIECFSLVNDGASLAVLWALISGENFAAAGEELSTVVHELKSSQVKRWQAIRMLRYILSSADYPWRIKSHVIDLLLSITDAQKSGESNDYHVDGSSVMTSVFACLQAIQETTIYAADPNLRKRCFSALKNEILYIDKVVWVMATSWFILVGTDLPPLQQYEMLKALIINDSSPSMIALLVDTIKEKIFVEFHQGVAKNDKTNEATLFWGSPALDMIEIILKPPKGGPPSLPEQTEPVLSALNLYRFILLSESTGKTNYSKALSKKSLRKALNEWLLPLKTLVSGMEAENREGSSEIAEITLCSLNPVQLVLHRCIELVEGFLEQSKVAR